MTLAERFDQWAQQYEQRGEAGRPAKGSAGRPAGRPAGGGQQEGEARLSLRLLTRRFGELPVDAVTRIQRANLPNWKPGATACWMRAVWPRCSSPAKRQSLAAGATVPCCAMQRHAFSWPDARGGRPFAPSPFTPPTSPHAAPSPSGCPLPPGAPAGWGLARVRPAADAPTPHGWPPCQIQQAQRRQRNAHAGGHAAEHGVVGRQLNHPLGSTPSLASHCSSRWR